MAKARVTNTGKSLPPKRPAISPEARENQLIALATDLVEQRLRDGTASSQETTHFLKLASTKSKLENKLLEAQTEMAIAKKDAIQSAKKMDELYEEAIKAMASYTGRGGSDY